jgi:hypothetical protein
MNRKSLKTEPYNTCYEAIWVTIAKPTKVILKGVNDDNSEQA